MIVPEVDDCVLCSFVVDVFSSCNVTVSAPVMHTAYIIIYACTCSDINSKCGIGVREC